MSKLKFGNPGKTNMDIEQAWVDRNRLNWEVGSSFFDILKNAINDWKKVKLSNVKSQKSYQNVVPKLDGVYYISINKKDQDFSETDRYKKTHEDFQISKLKKKQDKEIAANFLNDVLDKKLDDAYKGAVLLEDNKYKQRSDLIGVLDKNVLNEWDMVLWIVYDWNDSAKQYKILVWKNWNSLAWSYINDDQDRRNYIKWDKVYFVVVKNSTWKNILKEYYPKDWDLNPWDQIDLKFADVKLDSADRYEKDPKTGKMKTKKISLRNIKIKIGDYYSNLKTNLLPANYRPGKSLKLKIDSIVRNGNNLWIEFDQEHIKNNLSLQNNFIESNINKESSFDGDVRKIA